MKWVRVIYLICRTIHSLTDRKMNFGHIQMGSLKVSVKEKRNPYFIFVSSAYSSLPVFSMQDVKSAAKLFLEGFSHADA